MLSFIRESLVKQKQGYISKNFPNVNIILHKDMPSPSMSKAAELARIVSEINSLEPGIQRLSDQELRAKTEEFRKRIAENNKKLENELRELEDALARVAIPEEKERVKEKIKNIRNRIFEDILPQAFAVVREASRRTTTLRHFDVQLLGGIVLHEGRIAEMATGEGKTLVATLPAYLNALLGWGVHIITVNDYLARRDREWMGPIYEFLGLTVGTIQHENSDDQRRAAYACDITYGTNNEFGFDYLRDNMKYSHEDMVQRPFYFAIVDEVDSILIDEARTPLIISGPAEESTDKYYTAKKLAEQLRGRRVTERDEIDAKYRGEDLTKGYEYIADEKAQTIALTDEGEIKAARIWGIESLHSIDTMEYRHHTIQALRAKEFFEKDVDYVVKEGEVVIVDEFTGRMMPGRRWSDGLHQAVEAKEGMKIERENQTLATVTFQNYFRMYEKLAGMTGTAFTEANEFKAIYKLDVICLPTNRKLVRTNYHDCIYKTEKEKFKAVVDEISELYSKGQPALVGTISIDRSEKLSEMLKMRGIQHQVLNAKYHEVEAQIVAQAGRYKAVTIATNMAGRGTDILLGGNPEFIARSVVKQKYSLDDPNFQEEYKKLIEKFKDDARQEHDKVVSVGGLHVLGTERHEARRIDNQLRGRSGRQGDPGSSRFYVSLQDELMRLFGSDRLIGLMDKLGLEEGQVIEHPWVSRSIEVAQRRVETHNFEIRKQLLEYDNVMNKQREVIYGQRRSILEGTFTKEDIYAILEDLLDEALARHAVENQINAVALINEMKLRFGLDLTTLPADKDRARDELFNFAKAAYEEKEKITGEQILRHLEKIVFLQIIDSKWKDHLYAMDTLREGIGLRAYGQRDPLIEYQREAFNMFQEMNLSIQQEAVENIFKIKPRKEEVFRGVFTSTPQQLVHEETSGFEAGPIQEGIEGAPEHMPKRETPITQASSAKVGRNDPCPCGSGLKYKKCCGK